VWLVDRAEIRRAYYKSAVVPVVGETIMVQRMKRDDDGTWRRTGEPVPVRVTRVSATLITAASD
jgi:hypothetical protein